MKKLLVITPLQEEYNDLHHSLSALKLESRPDKIGKLDVHHFPALNIILARGGHGKTQFGIQTQYLLDHAKFGLVICAGAAGALASEVKVGDLIVATTTIEHDFNNKFVSRPKPQFHGDAKSIEQIKSLKLSNADFNVHFGIMAGGDEDVIELQRGRVTGFAQRAGCGMGGSRRCTCLRV